MVNGSKYEVVGDEVCDRISIAMLDSGKKPDGRMLVSTDEREAWIDSVKK